MRAAERRACLRAALGLSLLVAACAALAAGLGLFAGAPAAERRVAVNLWGEGVSLDGRGLYRRDSVSGAAQIRANDLVTLAAGIPLLGLAALAAARALRRDAGGDAAPGPREGLALAGMLGYFLYTYASMAFGAVFNELFLLYVLLFSASLAGFVCALLAVDAGELAARCAASFPRRGVMVLCGLVAAFLGFAWIGGRILPAYLGGGSPPGIDAYHTLYIQVLDLGLVAPAALLALVWLARRRPGGYLLGTVLVVKGAAMGLAVSAMGISMSLAGVKVSLPELLAFPAIAAAAGLLALRALRSAA